MSLPRFGGFETRHNPARKGRNSATGETIEIAALRKLIFVSAKQVKNALIS